MKRRWSWIYVLLLALAGCLAGCEIGGQSSVKGKLVDWNGKPVAGVKITASQVQPLKGYEQFEAVTGADGVFRIKGLFPSSAYVLKPFSDKWITATAVKVDRGSRWKTAVLPVKMTIAIAYAKNGSLILDLATGATRFTVSSDEVITDAVTGLEWVVGPDEDIDYTRAAQWVAACTVGGGNWRMPTPEELKGLYRQGLGERNMDPAFKATGWGVWAESKDSTGGRRFNFYGDGGDEFSGPHGRLGRVFGVRSRP